MKILWELLSSDEDDILFREDEDENISEYEKDEEEKYSGDLQTRRIMQTPFGLAVMDNSLNPFKKLQLFQFHTDFIITNNIFDTIEKTPGVEIIKILTPYRGVISIGKIFNSTDVRREIENRVIKKEIPNLLIKNKVEELQKEKLANYKNWSICIFPNGYADFCHVDENGSNLEEFNKITQMYRDSTEFSGSFVIEADKQ